MSGDGAFSVLPTEIWYSIISYLGSEDAAAFAKCSRHCYIVAFPHRFHGFHSLKLNDDNYLRLLRPFIGRGWLAPLRKYIRSMSFSIFNLNALPALRWTASLFPNIRSLTISIFSFDILDRNIYVAIFPLLSALPFYDEINNLSLIWAATGDNFYNNIEEFRRLPKSEQADPELFKWTMRQYPKAQSLLGPYISEEEFEQKVQEIRLPKYLRSFQTDIRVNRYAYLVPVPNSVHITTLHAQRAYRLFETELEFPTIKTLIMNMNGSTISIQRMFTPLCKQFPNLEALLIRNASLVDNSPYHDWSSTPQKITKLELPWGLNEELCRPQQLERLLVSMLDGNLPNVRTCKFVGTVDTPDRRIEIAATCTISKAKIQNREIEGGSWEFYWEGDLDFDQYDNDMKCWWESWGDEETEKLDSDYVCPECGGEEIESGELSEAEESEFSGDSEYPDTGDELYPTDSDEFTDSEPVDEIDELWGDEA
ncbi:hypothetical protein TWF281_006910 [Arthrobotrys megalospora]